MATTQRRDWRDVVSAAGDFALLGVAVFLASVPLVTIGTAVATGSYATRQWCVNRAMPPWRELARRFVSWLLPGVSATLVLLIVTALLALDIGLLSSGVVPGGPVVLVVTALTVCWLGVIAALAVVQFGRQDTPRWRAAVGWAIRASARAPHRAVVVVLVCALAVALAVMLPMTAPIIVGYWLLAMHTVADRLLPDELGEPGEPAALNPRGTDRGTGGDVHRDPGTRSAASKPAVGQKPKAGQKLAAGQRSAVGQKPEAGQKLAAGQKTPARKTPAKGAIGKRSARR